jgi:hypothetical protein
MICYLELKRVWTVSEQRILAMAEREQVVLHGAMVLGAPPVYRRGGPHRRSHQGPGDHQAPTTWRAEPDGRLPESPLR